jgi:predicted amidophosphoribosyltransferase
MIVVIEETPAQIREMGTLGHIVELCEDCQEPTRFWANNGEFPLCRNCCENRNAIKSKETKDGS